MFFFAVEIPSVFVATRDVIISPVPYTMPDLVRIQSGK